MGTGICAAILLEFSTERFDREKFTKYSTSGFLDNYKLLPKSKDSYYENFIIKDDIFFPYYADFITEFNNLIDDEFKGIHAPFNEEPIEAYTEKLLSCKNRQELEECFNREYRNGDVPFICSSPIAFSCIYCHKNYPFVFYSGSYKAYLEEYSTLTDIEKILAKAMTNPLKNAVKFGIFG